MPLYEFKCSECQREIEVLQSFDAESPLCPKCHLEMKRLVSPPSVVKIDNIPIKYKSLGMTPYKSWEPGPSEA